MIVFLVLHGHYINNKKSQNFISSPSTFLSISTFKTLSKIDCVKMPFELTKYR